MTIDAVARSSELSLSRFRVVQLGQDPADHAEGATDTQDSRSRSGGLVSVMPRRFTIIMVPANAWPSAGVYVRTHILMNA
jgi:hypothetical protein